MEPIRVHRSTPMRIGYVTQHQLWIVLTSRKQESEDEAWTELRNSENQSIDSYLPSFNRIISPCPSFTVRYHPENSTSTRVMGVSPRP